MTQFHAQLTLLIMFVVVISFVCITVLITEPELHVCDLVKRTDDCNFFLRGQ